MRLTINRTFIFAKSSHIARRAVLVGILNFFSVGLDVELHSGARSVSCVVCVEPGTLWNIFLARILDLASDLVIFIPVLITVVRNITTPGTSFGHVVLFDCDPSDADSIVANGYTSILSLGTRRILFNNDLLVVTNFYVSTTTFTQVQIISVPGINSSYLPLLDEVNTILPQTWRTV